MICLLQDTIHIVKLVPRFNFFDTIHFNFVTIHFKEETYHEVE